MPDRVLEIGGVAAGYAGRLFARTGAEVVRVALPSRGREFASPASLERFLHPGKRRLSLDPASRAAPRVLRELAAQADLVVVEADTADALNAIGFDQIEAPAKLAITPFGRTGPRRNWQATPSTLLAMGGYTRIIGDPGRAPLTLPGHYVEFQTGAFAYTAASAVRLAQQSQAAGAAPAVIDVGMLEVVMALSQFTTTLWHCGGEIRQRHGSDFWVVTPSDLFRCADGWVHVTILPAFWEAFTVFLGLPELVLDDRFASNRSRMAHREALHGLIAEQLTPLGRAEIGRRAAECRVPVGVVQTMAEVLNDPHLAARAFWESVTLAGAEPVAVPRGGFLIHGAPRGPTDVQPEQPIPVPAVSTDG